MTVDSDAPSVEGRVAFYDGDTLLGHADVDPATRTAVFRHIFTVPGDIDVTANYEGHEMKNSSVTTGVTVASTSSPLMTTVKSRSIDVTIPGTGTAPGTSPGTSPGTTPDANTETNGGSLGGSGSSQSGSSGSLLQSLFGLFSGGGIGDFFSKLLTMLMSFFTGFKG